MLCSNTKVVNQCFEQEFNIMPSITRYVLANYGYISESVKVTVLISVIKPTFDNQNNEQKYTVGVITRELNVNSETRYELANGNVLALSIANFYNLYIESYGTGDAGAVKLQGKCSFEFCDDKPVTGILCKNTVRESSLTCEDGIIGYKKIIVAGGESLIWNGEACNYNCGILCLQYTNNTLKRMVEEEEVECYPAVQAGKKDGTTTDIFIGYNLESENRRWGPLLLVPYRNIVWLKLTTIDAESGSADVEVDFNLNYW